METEKQRKLCMYSVLGQSEYIHITQYHFMLLAQLVLLIFFKVKSSNLLNFAELPKTTFR